MKYSTNLIIISLLLSLSVIGVLYPAFLQVLVGAAIILVVIIIFSMLQD